MSDASKSAALNAALLEKLEFLLPSCEFLHLSILPHDGEPPDLSLTVRRENRSQTFGGATLADVLGAWVGSGRKRCSRCGQEKEYREFPKAAVRGDRPEGRHSHCKVCDRARKKGKYLRSQRRKDGAGQAPST